MAGEIVHIEFPSQNVDRSAAFWGGLFGWEFGGPAMEGFDYRMASTGPNSGVAVTPSGEPGHPNYYFDTPDLDASLAKVKALGGETGDKTPVPGHGTFAACKDSEGNAFHLWQGDSSVT